MTVKGGDELVVTPPQTQPSHMVAANIPLDIVFEDDHILVLNKQAGLTVHPGPGHREETLIHALLHHCGQGLCSVGDVDRPGLVHRLDRETSGLMVVAKTDEAYQGLVPQFQTRTLQRTYLALVFGRTLQSSWTIDAPMGRHPRNRQKQAVVAKGKPAITHIKKRNSWCINEPDCWISEWQCCLETGRTHQIRVHAAHAGHPLVGDPVYGRSSVSQHYPERVRTFPRQALHATALSFQHPVSGEQLQFVAKPPQDYEELRQAIVESCAYSL